MKAVVATCFESNEERLSFVYDACVSRGYETVAITSDFSHIRKEKRNNIPDYALAIKAKPYKKNLSIRRILSHKKFAEDCFRRIEKEDPDLIWLMAPANSLIREAGKYKKKHPEKKLIIDIIDMWPESLPVSIGGNFLPFRIWKSIRSRNIGCCDALVTECDLYQEILRNEYKGNITTIHWARNGAAIIDEPEMPADKLSLCYIGSINNIIDADRIASLISNINYPVVLHVIGEGESTDRFLESMNRVCEVIYHGAIRDEKMKTEIFDQCHAGINIYREGLYIGLTVKCIDYFEHGMPIVNNIKGDTWNFVDEYRAGVNVSENTKINARELIDMRFSNNSIFDLYNRHFTKGVFTEKCLKVIDEVLK